MEVLVITQTQVRSLLAMTECIDVMSDALASLARGEVIQPLRPMLLLPERKGVLGLMPAYSSKLSAMAVKAITVMPGNAGSERDTHQGAVLLFDAEHGQLLAIMDASEITAIRTAAVSGLATRLLARSDTRVLTIVGTGVQARTHLDAMMAVRKFTEVRVWGRHRARLDQFVAKARARHAAVFSALDDLEAAVRGADVVCTLTSAREPIVRGAWLAEGCHVNAVGSSIAAARELDASAVARARVVVDCRESALHEAGDVLLAIEEGVINADHIRGELGEVILGNVPGRTREEELTMFKSVGMAVEDLATADYVWRKANAHKLGVTINLGGGRD